MFAKLLAVVVAGAMLLGAATAQTISREEYQKQLDQRRIEIDAMSRDDDPMGWAKAQSDFGRRLYAFDSVDEAIAAYRQALEVYSRDATPKEWAATEEFIGSAYRRQASMKATVGLFVMLGGGMPGSRSSGPPDITADVSGALQAFAAAQEVYTRVDFPGDWVRMELQQGLTHSLLSQSRGSDDTAAQEHRDAATARFNNVLVYTDAPTDHMWRAIAHQGLVSLNEHGFENETERIRFALDHAKLAKVEFTAAGEAEQAERMDRQISSLEYHLKHAEEYVPGELDSIFGARQN